MKMQQDDGGNVINAILNLNGTWIRSEFPHPLVVDYDDENESYFQFN